jgi:hypothetical protein
MLAQVRGWFAVLLAIVESGCVSIADLEPDVRFVLGSGGQVVVLFPNEHVNDDPDARGAPIHVWNAADPTLAHARQCEPGLADLEFVLRPKIPDLEVSPYLARRLSHARRLSRFDGISIGLVDGATLERVGLDRHGRYLYEFVDRAEFDALLARGDGPLVAGAHRFGGMDPREWWFGIDDWTRSRTAEVIIDPALLSAAPIASQAPE